jgi:hypothetical protein
MELCSLVSMEKLSVWLTSVVFQWLCTLLGFPALHFVTVLSPQKQMMPTKQEKLVEVTK